MAGFLVKFPVFPNIETDFPMFFIIIIYNYYLTSLLPMPKILQCLENKANFFLFAMCICASEEAPFAVSTWRIL